MANLATWRSGYAAACKAVYTGSIPVVASYKSLSLCRPRSRNHLDSCQAPACTPARFTVLATV